MLVLIGALIMVVGAFAVAAIDEVCLQSAASYRPPNSSFRRRNLYLRMAAVMLPSGLSRRAHIPMSLASMAPLTQGLLVGFFGSALYFAVDKYEPDRTVAFMLKLLVVMWGAAMLHCTGLFGYRFF